MQHNLLKRNGNVMKQKISYLLILTVAFLITGNLIGAGILGLPVQAGLDGFIPSLLAMLIVGGAMFFTAVILGNEASSVKKGNFNYPSLYQNYLGFAGKWVAIIANLIILYGLLTAYLTGAATIIRNLFGGVAVPHVCIMLIFFSLVTGLTVTNIKMIRKYNVFLIILMWVSFAVIVFMSERYVKIERLEYANWSLLPIAISVIVTSFHFHNIIPTVCQNLNWNSKVIWKTMLIGMIIGYVMNAIWAQVGIGALPLKGSAVSLVSAFKHNLPATVPLAGEIKSSLFTIFSLLFALIAITTSYLANGTGLLAFITDLTENYFRISNRILVIALSFGPPLIIAIMYPNIFLKALNVVGGVGIVVLFGILPSILAIIKARSHGARALGAFMLVLFVTILLFQLAQQFGIMKLGPDMQSWTFGLAHK